MNDKMNDEQAQKERELNRFGKFKRNDYILQSKMTGGCPPVPRYDIFVYFCAHETADEQSHYPPYHERNNGADAVSPLHAAMLLQRQGAAA